MGEIRRGLDKGNPPQGNNGATCQSPEERPQERRRVDRHHPLRAVKLEHYRVMPRFEFLIGQVEERLPSRNLDKLVPRFASLGEPNTARASRYQVETTLSRNPH